MEPTVKQSLDSLRQTLDESAVSTEQQVEIDTLLEDLRGAAESGSHDGLRERLDKALILFADDHPDIASAIRSVIHSLTQSGV